MRENDSPFSRRKSSGEAYGPHFHRTPPAPTTLLFSPAGLSSIHVYSPGSEKNAIKLDDSPGSPRSSFQPAIRSRTPKQEVKEGASAKALRKHPEFMRQAAGQSGILVAREHLRDLPMHLSAPEAGSIRLNERQNTWSLGDSWRKCDVGH